VNTFSPKLFAAWKRKEAPALVNKKGDEAALYLYDVIGSDPIFGGIAAKDVVAALQDASSSKSLTVFHRRRLLRGQGDLCRSRSLR
jgi:hypothetical protein